MHIGEVLLRTAAAFIFLVLLCRMIGKKEISQMTFFNYVSGIAFGSITASLLIDPSKNSWIGFTAMAGWAAMTWIAGYASLKSLKLRVMLSGQPTILIKDGKLLEKAMLGSRMTVDELTSMLRQKNVFSVKRVQYAILEQDGQLSVMLRQQFQPASKADVNAVPANNPQVPATVVTDGHVHTRILSERGLDEAWLKRELAKQGAADLNKVFFAEIGEDGALHADVYQDTP